jgi:dienelactone hydrolase
MSSTRASLELTLRDVARTTSPDGTERVILSTDRGDVECRLQLAARGEAAVVWVFGTGGGLGGPAHGVYTRVGRRLLGADVTSLEVAYRRPGDLAQCVLDTLLGVAYLGTLGRTRVVLVGHSFGGAVVITAGAASEQVIAVAALSSQSAGTAAVATLSPRPLLLAHGEADEVLAPACSRDIYSRARDPRRLILYPGCRHGLDQCEAELDRDLESWIREVVSIDKV